MKRLTILSIALAASIAAATSAPAQEKPKEPPKETTKPAQKIDVTGAWECAVETEQGTRNSTATFKQEGEKLTGTLAGQMGEVPLEGSIKGSEIAFAIVIDMQGQQFTISYKGKVDGDSMTGTVEFGSFGSSTWSAKKKKQ